MKNMDNTDVLNERIVNFPMRFSLMKRPKYITGSCQKCGKRLGAIIWMCHSTPALNWEDDPDYGDFILCASCGMEFK